jgi:hypothetical protein
MSNKYTISVIGNLYYFFCLTSNLSNVQLPREISIVEIKAVATSAVPLD